MKLSDKLHNLDIKLGTIWMKMRRIDTKLLLNTPIENINQLICDSYIDEVYTNHLVSKNILKRGKYVP